MRCGRWDGLLAGGAVVLATVAALASPARLPLIAGKGAVASVNGEAITLEELLGQIGTLHKGMAEPAAKARKPDPSALLQRIINAKLILQEARRIGLDQLPEVADQMKTLRMNLLKSALVERQVRDVAAADPKEVERLYRNAVREVKIDSILFANEEHAKALVAAVRAGGDFRALSEEAIQAGRGKGGEGEKYLKAAELRPEVAKIVSTLRPGALSAPIPLAEGFAVVKLLDVRTPENPEARRKAAEDALTARRQARLEEYMEALRKQYAQINRSLLDSLDYESKEPGLAKLRNDGRVVATVKGARPVTVKELTERVEKKFYHGLEGAIERKRVKPEVPLILDRILLERATLLEATRLKIERTDAYASAWKQQTESLLFDTFIKKVINPDIKLDPAELKKYYNGHLSDYTTPEMMRIDGLRFRRREDAQAAMDRLRKGADLKWMRANAGGQVDREGSGTLPEFNGSLLISASLPDGVRKALAGAGPGAFRFYAEPTGPFHVLAVRQVTAAAPQAFESVKADVTAKVFDLRRKGSLEDWAAKLRAASEIKIFAQAGKLNEILGLESAGGT